MTERSLTEIRDFIEGKTREVLGESFDSLEQLYRTLDRGEEDTQETKFILISGEINAYLG